MRRRSTRALVRAAVIAAAYTALALASSLFNLGFGPVQLRLSEALCILPMLYPEAVGGLFVGCLLTNILSPYGPLDVIIGSLATLIAALATAKCRRRGFAPLPPILCNGILVGGLIAWYEVGFAPIFPETFAIHASTVALGEAAATYLLGLPLITYLARRHKD